MSLEPGLRNAGLEDEGEPPCLWYLFPACSGEMTAGEGVNHFWLYIQYAPAACSVPCTHRANVPGGTQGYLMAELCPAELWIRVTAIMGKTFLPPGLRFTRPRCLFLPSVGLWDEPAFLVSPKLPRLWVLASQEWGTVSSGLPSTLPPGPVLEGLWMIDWRITGRRKLRQDRELRDWWLGSNSSFSTCQMYGLRQFTEPVCASVFLSVKWGWE